MSDNGCRENICTYGLKLFVFLCGVIGIIFSILAADSCDFISFVDTDGNPPEMAEDPPFDTALGASVGIFRYMITDVYAEEIEGGGDSSSAIFTSTTNVGCTSYEDMFFDLTGYPSIATAQFCALIAPVLAIGGLLANLVDFCVCNFNGSNMFGSLFFIGACFLSAGTFLLVADPAFCFEDSELECTVGSGVYYSMGSTIFYFISSILLFCAPHADPFCYNCGFQKKTEATKPVVVRRRRRSSDNDNNNDKEVKVAPQSTPHTTTIVNIIIDDVSKNKEQKSSNITTNSKKKKKQEKEEEEEKEEETDDVSKNKEQKSSNITTNTKKKKKKKQEKEDEEEEEEEKEEEIDDVSKNKEQKSSNITTKTKKKKRKKKMEDEEDTEKEEEKKKETA